MSIEQHAARRSSEPPVRISGTVTSSGTEATLRISDAAAEAGVSARTLRYYEELGLIAPSGHTAGGARRYAPEDLARIARIQELKEILGLNLDEIGAILETETRMEELRLAYRESKKAPTRSARAQQRAILQEALERRTVLIEQLDRKLTRLDAFRSTLVNETERCRGLLDDLETEHRLEARR